MIEDWKYHFAGYSVVERLGTEERDDYIFESNFLQFTYHLLSTTTHQGTQLEQSTDRWALA